MNGLQDSFAIGATSRVGEVTGCVSKSISPGPEAAHQCRQKDLASFAISRQVNCHVNGISCMLQSPVQVPQVSAAVQATYSHPPQSRCTSTLPMEYK